MLSKFSFYNLIQLILGIILILVLFYAWQNFELRQWIEEASTYAEGKGAIGVFIFSLIYILSTILMLPGPLLTFTAGAIYGFWALPIIIISSCIGASVAFLLAKFFLKKHVTRIMGKKLETQALKKAIESQGWKFMLLLRLSPMIPFNWNNYLLGSIQVKFFTYLWVTAVSAFPGTLFYVYLGTMGRKSTGYESAQWLIFIGGLVAIFVLTRMTLKKTREILQELQATDERML